MKILIVDDNIVNQMVIQKLLLDYGEADIASDGYEAVTIVTKAVRDREPYKLILLDIMMPNMSGREALKKIREMEESAGFPSGRGAKIIMFTALSDNKNILESFNDQCDAYVIKPVSKSSLEKAMKDAGVI